MTQLSLINHIKKSYFDSDSIWLKLSQNDSERGENTILVDTSYVDFPILWNDWILFSQWLIGDCGIILSFAELHHFEKDTFC
jgi:hypothetical protein